MRGEDHDLDGREALAMAVEVADGLERLLRPHIEQFAAQCLHRFREDVLKAGHRSPKDLDLLVEQAGPAAIKICSMRM